jgi:DNA-binding beta-propeller fold protein YncE
MARGIAAVVAGAALSAAGASGASPPGTAAAATATQVASVDSAGTLPGATASGTRLWIAHYNGPPGSGNGVASMAVSPDGTRVFVTGSSARAGAPGEFATVGYKTATGARLWSRRYHGPGSSPAGAASVAISPDGRTVFVTGTTGTEGINEDWATIAYQAATGARLWTARYDGPGKSSNDAASLVAASRDGKTVFVTGSSLDPSRPRGAGYTTIAYRAGTGARLWIAQYHRGTHPVAMAVRPGGGTVIVTGTNGNDYATVAYRAGTGARLWARHHGGPTGFRVYGGATALAFSPDGRTVFVTGNDYATVAYRAATGAQLWASPRLDASRAGTGAQLRASRSLGGYATALAVSPDGRKIFVTGPAFDPSSGNGIRGFTVVALGAATGARLWVNRYQGPRNLGGTGVVVAVSPDGRRVYVAGHTVWAIPRTLAYRYTIIAYRS